MTTLDDINRRTRAYAEARERLGELVRALQEGIQALQAERLPEIRRAIDRAGKAEAELRAAIESAPELFVKPKTLVLHGIKVGFAKGKGRIEFEDAEKVVQLIDRKLPELAETLVRVQRLPVKEALAQLTVQQLRAIGCTVEEANDRVVVTAVDTSIDKLVSALVAQARGKAAAAIEERTLST